MLVLFCCLNQYLSNFLFLMGYVEERLWWPIQSPNIVVSKHCSFFNINMDLNATNEDRALFLDPVGEMTRVTNK